MGVGYPGGSSRLSSSYSGSYSSPNPDPLKFRITRIREFGAGQKFCAAMISYDGCTNYEGKKLLVLKGSQDTIMELRSLDPHFQKNGIVVARFVPDESGWIYAVNLAKELGSGSVQSSR